MRLLLLIAAILTGACAMAQLSNGNFEDGISGWIATHGWYEAPQGAGLSEILAAPGEGHDGGGAMKMTGAGNRGIAMQIFNAYPGKYRITGWMKCKDMGDARAQILAEWMDAANKWMSGSGAGDIGGTTDWTFFDTVVEAPEGARSVHFDLLTNNPNSGTAWFDDLTIQRVPSGFPAPVAPQIEARTPDGGDGCLEVTWDKGSLSPGTMRLLIYCEAGEIGPGAVPVAVLDTEAGRGLVESLDCGKAYSVAARAVNADSEVSEIGPQTTATVADLQAPRPGWITATRAGAEVLVGWSPHVLDTDVKRISIVSAHADGTDEGELAASEVAALYAAPRPFYCTEPWVALRVPSPPTGGKVGVRCEDAAGNMGEVGWAERILEAPEPANLPGEVWAASATDQIARDSATPAAPSAAPALDLMRGQAKGFQIALRPGQDLSGVRVSFEPLAREGGQGQIDTRWLAWHFVEYVKLDANSRATPAEELVWKAPGDYPDELGDASFRDLPAGVAQPIYIRVSAPADAAPGNYTGRAWIEAAEGRRSVDITVRVSPIALPEKPRLKFVYWYSWGDPCKEFGVQERSADGWRVLAAIADQMKAHCENTVTVPWDMVRTWRAEDGTLSHDFRDFDRYVDVFASHGVDALFCLFHFGGRTTGEWECPTMGDHGYTIRDARTGETSMISCLELLPAIQEHLRDRGLLDRFCVHVADEPIPVNLDSYRELSAKVRQKAPDIPRIDAVHVPNLEGALEIWVPQLNYFEQWLDQYREAQRSGYEIWYYVAWVPQGKHPNRMIDSHAIKSRVLHWMNAMYDTTGYLHWALNRWSIPLTSLESPGDQYICWPSKRFIADSSLRYEAEREGLEDCELMFMLRDALVKSGMPRAEAQQAVEQIAREAVRNFQDYTRSWDELEAARRRLLQRLEEEG